MKLKELRHSHLRSLFSQKSPFCPFFGPFHPDFAHKSALRAEAAPHRLAPGKPGWPPTSNWPLFSRPTPHASRSTPNQGGQVVSRPSPTGYCLTPTADLSKSERDPIATNGPSLFSMSPNRPTASDKSNFFSPLAAARPLTILTW